MKAHPVSQGESYQGVVRLQDKPPIPPSTVTSTTNLPATAAIPALLEPTRDSYLREDSRKREVGSRRRARGGETASSVDRERIGKIVKSEMKKFLKVSCYLFLASWLSLHALTLLCCVQLYSCNTSSYWIFWTPQPHPPPSRLHLRWSRGRGQLPLPMAKRSHSPY